MPAGIAGLGLRAVGSDNGGGFFVPDSQVAPLVMLTRYLRQTIKNTLPEIVEIPETIDTFLIDTDTQRLITPVVVMLGRSARPGDAAVGEDLQILSYDFVYIQESVVEDLTNVQDFVRNQLVKLKLAFLADYRQSGYCNATRVIQDPIDHESQYKKIFSDQSQPVTALVLSMEFDVLERLPVR